MPVQNDTLHQPHVPSYFPAVLEIVCSILMLLAGCVKCSLQYVVVLTVLGGDSDLRSWPRMSESQLSRCIPECFRNIIGSSGYFTHLKISQYASTSYKYKYKLSHSISNDTSCEPVVRLRDFVAFCPVSFPAQNQPRTIPNMQTSQMQL